MNCQENLVKLEKFEAGIGEKAEFSDKGGSAYCPERVKIFEDNLGYVEKAVREIGRNLPPSVEREDLFNAGAIGLIVAIDKYDSSRGNKFTTYAYFKIRGEILSELRERDFLSRLSRREAREYKKTFGKLERELWRTPNDEEMAEQMEIPIEKIYKIKVWLDIFPVELDTVFDTVNYKDRRKRVGKHFLEGNFSCDSFLEEICLKETKVVLREAIERLPDKERLVISLYYVNGLTMKEAGKTIGITEGRVSQLHSSAIISLKKYVNNRKYVKSS